MLLPDIRKADVKGKTVFLRADLDVPLTQQITNNKQQITIGDDARLRAGLPTIQYLLDHGAKVIIGGHLDRPKGIDKSLSLKPVAVWLAKKFKVQSSKFKVERTKIDDFEGWEISDNLCLLENLRFYEWEENPSPPAHSGLSPSGSKTGGSGQEFVKKLASLADIYVNDAFAVCHRAHASTVRIAHFLPHFAGLRLQKEVEVLSSVLKSPKRPLVVIIGGKKIETKLPLVFKMYNLADYVLVGGKIAQEKASLGTTCQRTTHKCANLTIADLNKEGTDISKKDAESFLQVIRLAKTVVWNGPMGIIDSAKFNPLTTLRIDGERSRTIKVQSAELSGESTERGTREIAEELARSEAYKIVGGGDTTEFLKKIGMIDKFDFVSTGGGAMLSFLSGEKLPGLEALTL